LICENYYAYKDIIFTDLRSFTDNRLGDNYFLNNSYPRSTGISRSFVVINIFITIFILFFINGKWKSKFLFYIASFLFSLLISLLQSRGSALMFFLTFAAILYFAKKIDLKKKISLLFLIIFLPFLISKIISFTFYNLNISDKFENYNTNVIFNNSNLNNNFSNFIFKDRLINNKSSSGRVDIWKESFKKYDKKKIFGYGPQGDRFLLTKNNYSNNSSNALIYSLLSGGYFAFLIFLLIYFNILTKIYICIKKFKIFENNVDLEIKLSISFVIFLFLRSFFENSFSLFSLDFLLFICSVAYIDDYLKKKAYSKFSFLKYS
jgi:O-antigen ligase